MAQVVTLTKDRHDVHTCKLNLGKWWLKHFNKHWEEEAGDLMISRPVWTTFFHFGGWGSRQGFSGVCPGTHSIDRPGWPHSWRSTCVCLLIAKELKACTTISILLLNVLNSKQENVTLNILYLKLSRCGMLTKAVKYIQKSCCI